MALLLKRTKLLLFLLLLLFPASSLSADLLWEFDKGDSASGWLVRGGESRVENGSLVIDNGFSPELRSPRPLMPNAGLDGDANLSGLVLSFRVKSPRDALVEVTAFSLDNTSGYTKFHIRGGGLFREHRVYLATLLPSHKELYGVAIKAHGEISGLAFDSLRLYRPGLAGLTGAVWEGFWRPDPVVFEIINYVDSPRFGSFSFLTISYILIGVVFILSLIYFIVRGRGLSFYSARRPVIVAFIILSVIFLIRMDYNWAVTYQRDRRAMQGKDVVARQALLFGSPHEYLFDFFSEIKLAVDDGARIGPAFKSHQSRQAKLARYFLLPVDSSADPEYLWVFFDPDLVFDKSSGSLSSGQNLIKGLEKVYTYEGDHAALYRRRDLGRSK